ncbi:MAG: cyclase family protein [Chlamydiales bacterium]|nr:cyclase family protein [Chlamydiales bacterium]NCF71356.1 cyclase family protein [Chlamydiales bacterium]
MLNTYSLVDLTHALDPSIPSFNGRCGFEMSLKSDYDKGVKIYSYKCHAGIGTHIDAPSHFIPNASDVASIELESCLAPLCIIDVSDRAHEDFFLQVKDIQEFEKTTKAIEKESFVALHTGWDKRWSDNQRYRNVKEDKRMHFPGFSPDAASYLLEKNIKGIGIDTLSPDGSAESYPVHQLILSEGKYIIENLNKLSAVPSLGAHVLHAPSKVKGGTEAFVRSIAFVKK